MLDIQKILVYCQSIAHDVELTRSFLSRPITLKHFLFQSPSKPILKLENQQQWISMSSRVLLRINNIKLYSCLIYYKSSRWRLYESPDYGVNALLLIPYFPTTKETTFTNFIHVLQNTRQFRLINTIRKRINRYLQILYRFKRLLPIELSMQIQISIGNREQYLRSRFVSSSKRSNKIPCSKYFVYSRILFAFVQLFVS